jgi:hypothetical protein
MTMVHAGLDACLLDTRTPPLRRVRRFFEDKYRSEGYLGCLLGGLGQELSGVSEAFRRKVEQCFAAIAERIAGCLDEAVNHGDPPRATDTRAMAELPVNCWEGAALRTRLGGASGIAVLVDDIVRRHMDNPVIGPRFRPYLGRPDRLDTHRRTRSAWPFSGRRWCASRRSSCRRSSAPAPASRARTESTPGWQGRGR